MVEADELDGLEGGNFGVSPAIHDYNPDSNSKY